MEVIYEYDNMTRSMAGGPYGGTCSVCGASRRPADHHIFRLQYIEMEGYFDVCETCIRSCADVIGLITDEKIQKLQAENTKLRAELGSRDQRDIELVKLVNR